MLSQGGAYALVRFSTRNMPQHAATFCNMVAKRTQHIAPNSVAIRCVKRLRSFGRSLQILGQQWCNMLRWNAAIVWPGPYRTINQYGGTTCRPSFFRANPDTIGWVWRGFDLSMLRMDKEIFKTGKKRLRIWLKNIRILVNGALETFFCIWEALLTLTMLILHQLGFNFPLYSLAYLETKEHKNQTDWKKVNPKQIETIATVGIYSCNLVIPSQKIKL